jgi:hypothetical protein
MSATACDSLTPASSATLLTACICSGRILILIPTALIFPFLLLTYYPAFFCRLASIHRKPYYIPLWRCETVRLALFGLKTRISWRKVHIALFLLALIFYQRG